MIRNKILKKICAVFSAAICAVTMLGSAIEDIPVSAAELKEPLLTADDVIKQAATYLGVPYGWDCKGYDGVYSSNNPKKQSMETVRKLGLDCSGLVYATLTDLGVKTSGFSSNNPVPINYWETSDGHALTDCTMTYKGVTSKVEVLFDKQDASKPYYSSGKLVPGAIIAGVADGGIGHIWFYMGQFDNRDAVLNYLEKLGYNKNNVSKYVGDGNGKGGKHWRIECTGSQGCVINNNIEGKSVLSSFVAYKFTSVEVNFSIKKCLDGTTQIVGKSTVDGSTAKYGVYSDKDCKQKVGEINIGSDGTGSLKLTAGTYYVKEISAPKGYSVSDKVYTLEGGKTVTVYEDYKRGTIRINKTSEDNVKKDLEFKVTGSDGSSYTKKTSSVGMVDFSDLKVYNMKTGKPVTYTVSEINVQTRYETPKAQNITLVGGDADLTVTAKFENKLKKGGIRINKQSDDGDNGDREFTITGDGKTFTVKTSADGIAELTDIPVYDSNNKNIVYTISEKNVPVKYAVPADQTVTLTTDATTDVTFKNTLKKFTAEVSKKDSETGTAQGNASLAGAVYGLYLNGELVDSYTTNRVGYFKTKEYMCGSYVLKEILPSEGYLLDETEYPVGSDPTNYSVEVNVIPVDVTENVVKGKISIVKHSDNGVEQIDTPEEGAEFDVYLRSAGDYDSAKETERDHLICDENGFAETKLLPYGTYIVHQTKSWENTKPVDDFEVVISENGKNYSYILNDPVITSNVKIVKKDKESGNIIAKAGIGFKIWDANNSCYVTQTVNYPSEMTLDTFYTDETGMLMLPKELVYGKYELHEVQAANGYVLDGTPTPFTVDGTVETIIVEKYNQAQKGKISVTKRGEIFSNVTHEGETKYTPVFSESGLENAVFQVKAAEDIVTADGTVHANAGDVVAEITTNKDGYAETGLLYLGKYEITEIKAPYGYIADSTPQTVELTYAGQEIEVRDTVNTVFVNDYQQIEISLEKIMEESEAFKIFGKDCVPNVRFGLFAEEKITAADGSFIPENGLVSEVSVDENMTAKFAEKIPFGRYYVQEIATDEHHILNGEKYLVTFEYQGQEITTVYVNCGKFKNDLKKGEIEGIKCGENDEPLESALFGLFRADCSEFTEDTAIITAISDDDGKFGFTDIPYGSYIVHEIKAPEGYILSDKSYTAVISEDKEVIKITPTNEKIKGNIAVIKSDSEYIDNKLSGAEFTVFTDENCENKVGVLSETEKGYYLLEGLEYGKYFLKETIAPEGFAADKNVYPFVIDGTEQIITIEIDNTPQKGKISVSKSGEIFDRVDTVHEEGSEIFIPVFKEKYLAGAVYQITAAEDIVTADGMIHAKAGDIVSEITTGENGYAETGLLYLGKYNVAEIKAPQGYMLNEIPQTVELTYAGQEIEVRDTVNTVFVNDYQRIEICLKKVFENDGQFNDEDIADYRKVRFGLFAAEEITAADGSSIPENGMLSEIHLNENMSAIFPAKIPFGKYYVQELATDENYVLSDEKYYVTFEYQGQNISTVYVDCGEIINELKRGKISGVKINKSEEPLEGALFGLFMAEEESFMEETAVMTARSDKDGRFEFDDIPLGCYLVCEIEAPKGYIFSDETYPVDITENEQIILLTVENEAITVEISKADVYGNELEGAQMQLIDDKGNIVDEWISDGTNHVVTALAAGRYVLKEIAAPDGYIVATDIKFEVDINGNVTVESTETVSDDNGNLIIMVDDSTKVTVSKQDVTTGKELPGAKLQVLDKEGNVIEEWTSTEEAHFIEGVLKADETYILREITAPDGYDTAEDIEFTVKADGSVTEVIMKDERVRTRVPTPYTGDSGNHILAWVMIGMSLAISAVLFIRRRIKKSKGMNDEI